MKEIKSNMTKKSVQLNAFFINLQLQQNYLAGGIKPAKRLLNLDNCPPVSINF